MRDYPKMQPLDIRLSIRAGEFDHPTSGLAKGYVQANIVILPEEYAYDFLLFCQRNPTPCPLLAVSEPGRPELPVLGDFDIRTDIGRYRVMQHGEETEERTDIIDLWRDDFVIFALGCSYSFEEALLREGLILRNHETNAGLPMYKTNIETVTAGRFKGHVVVTMRAFEPADAIKAIRVTSRFPRVHGAPLHIGMPEMIGIDDLHRDAWGGFEVRIAPRQLPLFWACGVTAQLAIAQAKPPIAIMHSPGYMLVTDILNSTLEA